MRAVTSYGVVVAVILLSCTNTTSAAITGLQRVASSLSAPMFVTHAPGDTSRLFIAQRGGAIRVLNLNTGVLESTPFLTMSGIDTGGSEGGFLGLAFHPDYFNESAAGHGKFYVKITTAGSDLTVRIREYTVSEANPNLADSSSAREVLTYTNPAANHVGGWIGFSPNNKFLYIANGDGGGGYDNGPGHTDEPTVKGNAQDITNNFLGKMLRINPLDPDGPTQPLTYSIPSNNPMVAGVGSSSDDIGDDEIWAYGLRNPFRDSFDRLTGDLWIGDVGQGAREEISRQPADAPAGENFGWRLREGNIQTPGVGGAIPANYRAPVYDYNRDNDQFGGSVVTGGYVYRGPDPSLQGQYFFLDSRNSPATTDDNYWKFDPANPFGTVENIDALLTPNVGTAQFPVSFGEDAVGNLYIAYIVTGNVYRIATNEVIAGDYNADGFVDDADYLVWSGNLGATAGAGLAADGNDDNVVDAADFTIWRDNFGNSVHALGAGSGIGVPEPSTAVLVAALPVMALLRWRRVQIIV